MRNPEEGVQVLTLTMDDDVQVEFGPGRGGTLKDPVPLTRGIGTFDAPNGDGVFLVGTSAPYHESNRQGVQLFKELRIHGGAHVPFAGSLPVLNGQGTILMPDLPEYHQATTSSQIAGSNQMYALRGGDVIWVPFYGQGFQKPTAEVQARFLDLIEDNTEWEEAKKWPRMQHLKGLFGHGPDVGLLGPTGGRDAHWLIRNWRARTGEVDQIGYFAELNPRWGSGFDNSHYGALLYHCLHFAETHGDQDWWMMVGMAISHATQGRVHTGKHAGLAQYEKGQGLPGDYYGPSFSKQWGMNLIAPWMLTDQHPVLDLFVQEHREALKRWTLAQVWTGAWGARIMARFLEDCLIYWTIFKDPEIEATLRACIAYCLDLLDPDLLYWVNTGSSVTTSPWMNSQLARVLYKVGEKVGWLPGQKQQLMDVMHSILEKGTMFVGTHRAVRYRFTGPDNGPGHVALSSFMIPMLRCMVAEDRGERSVLEEFEDVAYNRWGCSWGNIDTPPPIEDIGMEYGPQGSGGWPKVCKFTMQSFVT